MDTQQQADSASGTVDVHPIEVAEHKSSASTPADGYLQSKLQSKGATQLRKFVVDNHLLLFLALAFIVGLSLPHPGREISKPVLDMGFLGQMRVVQSLNVVIIFLISGLRLKTDAVFGALRSPIPLITGLFMILAITPCLGFLAVRLPLQPLEFSYGLALFCCVPTTLTSGAALVSGCKGAQRASELALMITVATNLLGALTTPFTLAMVLSASDVSIDVSKLLAKLCLVLLLPTLVGKVVQTAVPGAAAFSKKHKTPLTVFSNFNMVCVVWQSVSRAQKDIVGQPGGQIVACIVAGIGAHVAFWAINMVVWVVPGVKDVHHRRAVFLLSSQKTLPVSLAIIAGLPESFGQAGLLALPCIFGHLSQLVMDTFLVSHWAKNPYSLLEKSLDQADLSAQSLEKDPACPVGEVPMGDTPPSLAYPSPDLEEALPSNAATTVLAESR